MNLITLLIAFGSFLLQNVYACEVKLTNGNVILSETLPMTPVLPEETKNCMHSLGERLKEIKGLRSVT